MPHISLGRQAASEGLPTYSRRTSPHGLKPIKSTSHAFLTQAHNPTTSSSLGPQAYNGGGQSNVDTTMNNLFSQSVLFRMVQNLGFQVRKEQPSAQEAKPGGACSAPGTAAKLCSRASLPAHPARHS